MAPPVEEALKVQALRDPRLHGEPAPAAIEVIETHFAWIFLSAREAYKMKKALRLDRLDNRTLEARRFGCEEEVRLNRRLAPEVYLGVVPLRMRADGSLGLGSQGEPVEWLVRMRRLPRSKFLDQAIAARALSLERLQPVARLLAQFYATQPPVRFTAGGYLTRLERRSAACFAALQAPPLRLPGALLEALREREHALCAQVALALGDRDRDGRIVEAHGDLKAEHIFLGPPPCIIDCLEFDRDLRIRDPLEELASLELECERLGARWVARTMLDAYLSRAQDELDEGVYAYYRMSCALQRARTLAWHLLDPALCDRKDWAALATEVLQRVA